MRARTWFLAVCMGLLACGPFPARGADWPTWRRDAARSAASPEELPDRLYLQWVREFPRLEPAWPDEPRMRFDAAYEPVVLGKSLFLASPRSDSVAALDTETGAERWRFYADGPVRFAPLAWRAAGGDRVCFACDDGYLYCLDAARGSLVWRFRGGPSDRKLLGNARLISAWPVRGGPVLDGGTLYFAAGIWPFMGVFLYALDPETGNALWTNDGCGSLFLKQPHDSPAFAGIAPQGYLAVAGDKLLVPNGRAVPACFERATGELFYYRLAANGKRGDCRVSAARDSFFNSGMAFDLATGTSTARVESLPVGAGDTLYVYEGGKIAAYGPASGEPSFVRDREGRMARRWPWEKLWDIRANGRVCIQAGSRLYAGERRMLQAIALPRPGREPEVAWQMPIAGTPTTMLAADGKLFAVTLEGALYCFGPKPAEAKMPEVAEDRLVPMGSAWKYLDDGSKPGKSWRAVDFDDGAWLAGPAELGYGDGDEATVVRGRKKFITTYFRHAFQLEPQSRLTGLHLDLLADDGAVAYLNGTEVARVRMPSGAIGPATCATEISVEGDYDTVQVDPALLVRGTNVLAVEVHQVSTVSSDLSFNLELAATRAAEKKQAPAPEDRWTREAKDILARTGATEGYCLVLGVGTGRLAEELARQSKLRVIGVDPDAARVEAARRRLDAAGLYGARVALLAGDPPSYPMPPYFASLVASEDLKAGGLDAAAFVGNVFQCLRPYGGVACLRVPAGEQAALVDRIGEARLPNSDLRLDGDLVLWRRAGALPGAADWTHDHADAANTCISMDRRVRAPLGLLWFGGSSNQLHLPRHGHGPSEQVVGGRLFLEGPNGLRAMDVYTGRVLWDRRLPDLGRAYDNTNHQPGANAIGSNFASAPDGIYASYGESLLRLDPATGETLSEFTLPAVVGAQPPLVSYVALWQDVLLAAGAPMSFEQDSDFSPGEFEDWKEEDLQRIARWVRSLKGFEPVEAFRAENGSEDKEQQLVEFLVDNLNLLLGDVSLLDRLPRDAAALKKVEGIQKSIDLYLRSHGGRSGYLPALRQLNRKLLEEYNDGLPRGRFLFGAPSVWSGTSSKWLVAMNRHSGKVLWARFAAHGFHHNGIAVGGGKVFCIDRLPEGLLQVMKRRGVKPPVDTRLVAFDARTGIRLWSTDRDVFGTWLGYSEPRDVLLLAGRASRDTLSEPSKRMAAYRGQDGALLWDKPHLYGGPCMIHGDTIIAQGKAFDLLTGDEKTRKHPLSGKEIPWRFSRNYGCNTAIGSWNLLTFRSAAAGFYDLATDGGTGNLGGFRSGCSSNLVVADGVLNAPDYTRTCVCSYPIQTSVALIHDPDAELWTFNRIKADSPVRRVGLNFAAPGDRMGPDGTLWLDTPSVGGPSPDIPVLIVPEQPGQFRHHSSWVRGDGLKWVAASGFRGVESIALTLRKPDGDETRPYSVRLHFVEPDDLEPGQRVFDVGLQGAKALAGLDVAKEAGGPRRPLVKTFAGVQVADVLTLTFTPAGPRPPVICGIEVLAEGW